MFLCEWLKVVWDLFVSSVIIWSVLEVTYRLGFDQPASGGWLVLSYVVDVIFCMDILVSFRTAILTKEGIVVVDKRQAAVTYVKVKGYRLFLSTEGALG